MFERCYSAALPNICIEIGNILALKIINTVRVIYVGRKIMTFCEYQIQIFAEP